MKIKHLIVVVFLALICSSAWTWAQNQPRIEPSSRSAQSSYVYLAGKESVITIRASVTGDVKNPGLFEIEKGWRLDELLAATGGPTLGQRRQQDVRSVRVRISRETENGRIVIYDEQYEGMLMSPEDYPVIQNGDWVSVETTLNEGFSKRDMLSVAGLAIGVINLIVTIIKN